MELREIGEMLRQERERKGISVDEVIQKTKISRRNIHAIEEGDRDHLPHPVYAKGFVKNYARFLKLDEEKVANLFGQVYPVIEEECLIDETAEAPCELTFDKRKLAMILFIGGAVVALALIVSLVLYLSTSDKEKSKAGIEKSQPIAVEEVRNSTSAGLSANSAEVESQIVTAQPQKTTTEKTASNAVAIPPVSTQSQFGTSKENSLTIFAVASCWLVATVDTKPYEAFLKPGERLTIKFASALNLRLGNAGGVQLSLNGRSYPISAQSGQVMDLRFPPKVL